MNSRRCCDAFPSSKLTVPKTSVASERMNLFGGAYESRHDDCLQRGALQSNEPVTPRRFTCHEIQYKTENRKKEKNETRKSICCQMGSEQSSMARRNSRNVIGDSKHDDGSNSDEASHGKSTEICPSSPLESQDHFTELELVECNFELKDAPMTNMIVRSVTTDSLKEPLKNCSGSESRAVTNNSLNPNSSSFVVDNPKLQPQSSQVFRVEPLGSPSRDCASTSHPSQGALTSNSRGPDGVDALAQFDSRPVRHARNTGSNTSGKPANSAPVRMPPTLQDTIVNNLVRRLGVAVWNWREDDVKSIEDFVTSYRRVVPAHIRRLMLERVQQEGRIWHTVTLRLLQLLLAADCSEAVRLQQVRVFFRDQFLACLTPLSRLTVLRVEDPTWRAKPQQERLLCAALPSLQRLQVLSLHYLATDAVLAAAVDNCPHLQVLDVFFSSAVTNKGAHWLLGHRDAGVQAACAPMRPQRQKRWYSSAMSWLKRGPGKRRKNRRESRHTLSASRHSSKSQEQLCSRPGSSIASVSPQVSSRAAIVADTAAPPNKQRLNFIKLLPQLRVLDLRGTRVSGDTIMEMMESLPEVKVMAIPAASD